MSAIGLGTMTGLALWWYVWVPKTHEARNTGDSTVREEQHQPESNTNRAIAYARAFQVGAWDEIIDTTWWMQERLARVRLESANPQAIVQARQKLRTRLRTKAIESNQLRPEGIEDQYIFVPTADIRIVSYDQGHADLAKPVGRRTWIRVHYPNRHTALRDEQGRPIRSIVVGVNLSTDGYILKANVLGNMDIRQDYSTYQDNRDGVRK